jgi:hypothetical protein
MDIKMNNAWQLRFNGESEGRLIEEGKLEEYLKSVDPGKLTSIKDIRLRRVIT